jgi:hypothetical protein
MNERMNERMTFLDDGGEGGSYSSKPSLFAQHQPYTEEGWFLPLIWVTSLDVTSPDVTDSRKKRNHGQSDFLRQKIW